MPARDKYHQSAKNALIKDGWTITDDPLRLRFGGKDMYVDLAAERLLTAEKEGRQIAVEIKIGLKQVMYRRLSNLRLIWLTQFWRSPNDLRIKTSAD